MHPPAGASGAGLQQGVVGLGERLWVGEPGRLSLDDREWWRPEEKLRLVCSTDDCFEIFLKSDFRLGVRNPGSSKPLPPAARAAQMCHRSCMNPPRQPGRRSPLLRLPPSAPLVPARHAALGHILPCRAHLDGGVLQGCGPKGNLVATLQEGWQGVACVPSIQRAVHAPTHPSTHPLEAPDPNHPLLT